MKLAQISIGACLFLCASFLVGCATPAQPKAMVAQSLPQVGVGASHDPVTVLVTGGHETDPMWTSMISNEDFQTALVESLRKSGLFRSVDTGGNAPYRLKVRLESLNQPAVGFDMTVTLQANWTLLRSPDEGVVWDQKVISSYTATVGQAFAGTTRLRLATEGAARQNIEQGLAKLTAAKF